MVYELMRDVWTFVRERALAVALWTLVILAVAVVLAARFQPEPFATPGTLR